MEGYLFILAVIVVVFIAWAVATDKIIYRGLASVTPNDMKHVSRTHRTVMVVPFKQLHLGSNIIVGVVSNAKAAEIARAPFVNRQVVVRRRLFGEPRVTRIS